MNPAKPYPRILWVSPEAAPYASTGGLAEVAGAMPRRLHAAGWPVELLIPYYTERCSSADAPEITGSTPLKLELAGTEFEVEIVHALAPDVRIVVRARYVQDLDQLFAAGASEVVAFSSKAIGSTTSSATRCRSAAMAVLIRSRTNPAVSSSSVLRSDLIS